MENSQSNNPGNNQPKDTEFISEPETGINDTSWFTEDEDKPEIDWYVDEVGEFSYYNPPIRNVTPSKDVTVQEVFELVTGKELVRVTSVYRKQLDISVKKAREYKATKFPYVTPAGVFTKRKDANLDAISGLMVLDFDHLENLKAVRQRLIEDQVISPKLIFTSPGGEGLKVFIGINPTTEDLELNSKKLGRWWVSLNHYFSIHYYDCITLEKPDEYIDGACKDLSRACFLCHDPEAWYSDNDISLNDDFIKEYTPNEVPKQTHKENSTPTPKDDSNTPESAPGLNIQECAKRHLLDPGQNHHPDFLAFIGACREIPGMQPEALIKYLDDRPDLASPDSGKADSAELKKLVYDVWKRYPANTSLEVIPLDPLTFAIGVWRFEWKNKKIGFMVKGFYLGGFAEVMRENGVFKKYVNSDTSIIVHLEGPVLSEIKIENAKDIFVSYLDSLTDVYFKYAGKDYNLIKQLQNHLWHSQSHLLFNKNAAENLGIDDMPILRDTKDEAFFTFRNGIISVSKKGIQDLKSFDRIKDKRIWKDRIIENDFEYTSDNINCEFSEFLLNVSGGDERRFLTARSVIGYLLHSFSVPSINNAIIIYDEQLTDPDKPMGGTGKGVFAQAIQIMKSTTKINGKELDPKDRFKWQSIGPGVDIVWLDDLRKDFDFEGLNSHLTNGLTVDRKYLPQLFFPPEDSPKWLICSNTIIENKGTTNKRRQFAIEFAPYYSSRIKTGTERPIEDEHGGLFFSNESWHRMQWNKFYSFMLDSVCLYLNEGLIPSESQNIATNKLIKDTNMDFVSWLNERGFILDETYETKKEFTNFKFAVYGEGSRFAQRTFTKWLRLYAESKEWSHEMQRSNSVDYFYFTKST